VLSASERGAGVACVVAATLLSAPAAALAEPASDATQGRIQGDVTVSGALGAAVVPRGPRAEADVRLRYLESAGVFVAYEEARWVGSGAIPRRVLSTGVELRPLFLFRWLKDRESSVALLDLTLDSLGLELGAAFQPSGGDGLSSRPGLQAGLGVEVPISGAATGLWVGLHGGLRWSDTALSSGATATAADRAGYLTVTLAWHQSINAHIVDAGDQAPR
jgi:hypothetical protein